MSGTTFLTEVGGQYEDNERLAVTSTSQSTLLLQKKKKMKEVGARVSRLPAHCARGGYANRTLRVASKTKMPREKACYARATLRRCWHCPSVGGRNGASPGPIGKRAPFDDRHRHSHPAARGTFSAGLAPSGTRCCPVRARTFGSRTTEKKSLARAAHAQR